MEIVKVFVFHAIWVHLHDHFNTLAFRHYIHFSDKITFPPPSLKVFVILCQWYSNIKIVTIIKYKILFIVTCAFPAAISTTSPVILYCIDLIWWHSKGCRVLKARREASIALKSQNFTWKAKINCNLNNFKHFATCTVEQNKEW